MHVIIIFSIILVVIIISFLLFLVTVSIKREKDPILPTVSKPCTNLRHNVRRVNSKQKTHHQRNQSMSILIPLGNPANEN